MTNLNRMPEANNALNENNRASIRSSPLLFFCFFSAISIAIWWNPLRSTFSLALQNEQYTHILLVLPVSVVLIFLDWNSSVASASPSLIPVSLITIAVLLRIISPRLFSAPDIELAAEMLGFVLWSISAFALSFGRQAFRRAMFPLFFLLWMVPLPGFAVNIIVRLLQHGSAAAAHLFFLLGRVPVEQRGLLLRIPGFILEVAPECSSIRSSMILVVTTMVLAYLLLHSQWRRALLVAISIPLAVVKNGLRIFVLGFLAVRVDASFLTGRLHHEGGFIYLLIALTVIGVLLWMLRKGEAREMESGKIKNRSAVSRSG
jgi:exosortase